MELFKEVYKIEPSSNNIIAAEPKLDLPPSPPPPPESIEWFIAGSAF